MRYDTAVTSVSWIPSEAIGGMAKVPFEAGVTHYDEPPPEQLGDLEALRRADRFRFANLLSAWAEFDDRGRVVGHGQGGGGRIGVTNVRVGRRQVTFAAFQMPDIVGEPEVGDGWVRFTQTTGGRTGLPAPRRVAKAPFVQWEAPLVWATLAVTIHADGRCDHELVGASPFPRHWVYGPGGDLVAKSGLMDFKGWYRHAFGPHSPWGDTDSPAVVTAVETALERQLSSTIMRGGATPRVRKVGEGRVLVAQGDPGDDLFLLLDGVLAVEVDGEVLGQLGPGAVMGERALLEGGARTSTLRAITPCRVAEARGADIDRQALAELSSGHRREERRAG
jgi:hypothetical protein